jgi:hypothetical protein
MPFTRHDLVIRPERIQLIAEQQTANFPWYLGCFLEINAVGQIGSGVVCTGLTPPGGWGEAPVREGEGDWPCRGGAAKRYGLIGSIDGGMHWFFVGRGITMLADGPPTTPPISLLLAVNRPNLTATAAGDHQWDVVVETFEPGPGDDLLSPMMCSRVRTNIDNIRMSASDTCDQIGSANRALMARENETSIASQVAGALGLALIIVAMPVLIPQQLAQNATISAALATLRGALAAILSAIRPGGIPVGAVLSGAVAALVAAQTTRTATTAATANASPVGINPFVRIAIVALTIALIAATGVAIALALSLLTLNAERDNARSDWFSRIEHLRSLFTLARRTCVDMGDESLPTCMALERS